MSDFNSILDLGEDGLAEVLAVAADVKADRFGRTTALSGKSVGLFFMKPSTRTRVSCELATVELGAHPVVLKQDEVGLGKREAVQDVAQVLDRYLDVLAFRVFDHQDLVDLATHADAPVINLLSDREHPCQALADLQTVAESRPLKGATIAYIGDGNNVAHSLMVGATMSGASVTVVTPEGYEPAEEFVSLAAGFGAVDVTNDPDGVAGADVVYTDVWASMGQEGEASERNRLFSRYQVNDQLLAKAAEDAIFLHCLPAHRGEEVSDSVMDGLHSRAFDQAENRLHAFKALLLRLAA